MGKNIDTIDKFKYNIKINSVIKSYIKSIVMNKLGEKSCCS